MSTDGVFLHEFMYNMLEAIRAHPLSVIPISLSLFMILWMFCWLFSEFLVHLPDLSIFHLVLLQYLLLYPHSYYAAFNLIIAV